MTYYTHAEVLTAHIADLRGAARNLLVPTDAHHIQSAVLWASEAGAADELRTLAGLYAGYAFGDRNYLCKMSLAELLQKLLDRRQDHDAT